MTHIMYTYESCHTLIPIAVSHLKISDLLCVWGGEGMSHICVCHVTYMDESCHTLVPITVSNMQISNLLCVCVRGGMAHIISPPPTTFHYLKEWYHISRTHEVSKDTRLTGLSLSLPPCLSLHFAQPEQVVFILSADVLSKSTRQT